MHRRASSNTSLLLLWLKSSREHWIESRYALPPPWPLPRSHTCRCPCRSASYPREKRLWWEGVWEKPKSICNYADSAQDSNGFRNHLAGYRRYCFSCAILHLNYGELPLKVKSALETVKKMRIVWVSDWSSKLLPIVEGNSELPCPQFPILQ